MALIARPVAGKKKSEIICEAFIAGAPKDAIGDVFFGVDQSNARHWNRVQRQGSPYFYCDNSFFDSVRAAQFRVARNHMQIDAAAHTSDGKRFAALDLQVKPLQPNDVGHWVLIEQSPSFMQLVGDPGWFDGAQRWAANTGRKVVVRRWLRNKAQAQNTLQADLRGAWGLLAHSSAAAVTAMLEGIPARVERNSAVASIQQSVDNSRDQRLQALQVLADHQFTLDEMKEGMAWEKAGS